MPETFVPETDAEKIEPIGEDVLDALRAADLSTAGVVGDVKLDSPTDWIEDGQ